MSPDEALPPITFMAFGCDHYQNLHDLSNVKSDLDRIKDVLTNSKFSIYPKTSFIEVYDKTSTELRNEIQNYVYTRSADQDILYLFFAGHGTAIGRDDFGFCMKDTVLHPEDNIILPTSVVKLSEIIGSLYIKNISLILLIDACYSGQISKQLVVKFPDLVVELTKSLIAYTGSFFGLVTSCSEREQIRDVGVISKALIDVCEQGVDPKEQNLTFGMLPEILTGVIDNHSKGNTRSRIFIPPGRISNLPLCRNAQYFEPPEQITFYSFTQPYLQLLKVMWNDGNPIALRPGEILLETGSQSAYANHNKLSFQHWELLTNNRGKRILSPKGIKFICGEIKIPKTLAFNMKTREITPAHNSPSIIVMEEIDIFGNIEKVIKEVEPHF